MNCTECQDNLVAYLEGTLAAEAAAACRKHLETCAACRSQEAAGNDLRQRLVRHGAMATGISLAGPVMERIRQREAEERQPESERSTFMSRLFQWRWSLGLGAVASAAVLILVAILATPESPASAAEIMSRGAKAGAGLRSIHLRGTLRTLPADNFSFIAPDQEPVPVEFWKEFTPVVRWRAEKPGRIAVMDGQETMLWIKPDYAFKVPEPCSSAFDTQWLHEIANLGQALQDELKAIEKHGWKTRSTLEKGADGKMRSVVSVEAKSGYPNDDYLKNAFFCTADTRRVYEFDEPGGALSAARIYLQVASEDRLLFELTQIETDPVIASEVFQVSVPDDVTWHQEMQILPDNEKYVAMNPEQAARTFFEACGKEDWTEAGKFMTVTRAVKEFYGGVKIIGLGKSFTSLLSAISGAQFVPYEIQMKDGTVKKHNIALKRDSKTQRWFVDGGI